MHTSSTLTAVVFTAALATPALAAGPTTPAAGPHGAATSEAQQQALDALGQPNLADTPHGIDPVMWKALLGKSEPPTAARVALGRRLYFDTKLSADGTVSCATCHDVTRDFVDQRGTSEGIKDQLGRRNAPTTANAALLRTFFWDGRAATLEMQAGLPILNPIEMGQPSKEAVIAAVNADPTYGPAFQAAYGRAPNYADLENAIASFERTLIFLDAPFDAFLAGNLGAISADARKGWELFNGKARCVSCHPMTASNPLGTDHNFHNIGVAARVASFSALAKQAAGILGASPSLETVDKLALETDASELGRFLVTKNRADIGAFRTPMLRNVGLTAPYMHDGSLRTLWDVMDHYNKGGEANPHLDGGIEPLALSEDEINQMVAFLFALTDQRFTARNDSALAAQRAHAQTARPFRDDALAQRKRLAFEAPTPQK